MTTLSCSSCVRLPRTENPTLRGDDSSFVRSWINSVRISCLCRVHSFLGFNASKKTFPWPFLVKISFISISVNRNNCTILSCFSLLRAVSFSRVPVSLSASSMLDSINDLCLACSFQDVIEGRKWNWMLFGHWKYEVSKQGRKEGNLFTRTVEFTADFSLPLFKLLKYYVWFISHKVNNMRELIHKFIILDISDDSVSCSYNWRTGKRATAILLFPASFLKYILN